MSKLSEIFTEEAIETLQLRAPGLALFRRDDWKQYLELVAIIYSSFDDLGSRVDYSRVEARVDAFYASRDRQDISPKRGQFFRIMIESLRFLRDGHDGSGQRYISPTPEGRRMLQLLSDLMQSSRSKFVGSGAETMLRALNDIATDAGRMSDDEAIALHEEEIARLREDIARIRQDGLRASKMIPFVSREENLARAEQSAGEILAAAEEIKAHFVSVRKELLAHYIDKTFTAGEALSFTTDFDLKLRQTPEYESYTNAINILGYIEGLANPSLKLRNVDDLVRRLVEKRLMTKEAMGRSPLKNFQQAFDRMVTDINRARANQIEILQRQLHAAVHGKGQKVGRDLSDMLAGLLKLGTGAKDFLSDSRLLFDSPLWAGASLSLHKLEIPSELAPQQVSVSDTSDSMSLLLEASAKNDQLSIADTVARLSRALTASGSVQLSSYPLELGLGESYVLMNIESFDSSIVATRVGTTDLLVKCDGGYFRLLGVDDYLFSKKDSLVPEGSEERQ